MKRTEILKKIEKLVYDRRGPAKEAYWHGKRVLKYPTDLILYAEIIHNQKPDFIIETGTRYGGSASFFADCCLLEGHGHVVTIEKEESLVPKDLGNSDYITTIIDSSVSDTMWAALVNMFGGVNEKRMVVLDSNHSYEHVKKELEIYSEYVTVGQYLIVEDLYAEGAIRAVDEFLKEHKGKFVRDKKIERYGIHCARDGFLKRLDQ